MNAKEMTVLQYFYQLLEFVGILKIGIDIGNDEIRLMESINLPFYYKILNVKREKIAEVDRLAFFIERFLEKNATHHINRVSLTLSGAAVIPVFLHFPGIPMDKLPKVIAWETEKHVPIRPEDAYQGYQIMSHEHLKGMDSWGVLSACIKKEEMNKLVKCFEQLNIILLRVSYLPIHLFQAVLPEKSNNYQGLVAVLPHAVILYIYTGNHLVHFARYDGNYLKLNSITIKNILIFFSDFIKSDQAKRENAFLEKILVIGDESTKQMETLVSNITDSLNIHSMTADFRYFYNFVERFGLALHDVDLAAYLNVGLVRNRLNFPLFRVNYLKDLAIRVMITGVLLLNLFSLVMIGPMICTFIRGAMIERLKNTPVEKLQNPSDILLAQDISKIKEQAFLEERRKSLTAKIREMQNSGGPSSSLRLVLQAISKNIPQDVWLENISINGQSGELRGYSLSSEGLDTFISGLSESGIMKNVAFQSAKASSESKRQILQFSLTFGVGR